MRRKLLILAAVLVLAITTGIIITQRSRVATGAHIDTVPDDSTILIDGSIKAKAGIIKLAPGTHSVKVSRRGFADKSASVSVTTQKISSLNIALTPNSAEGYAWLEDHPEQVIKAEGFSGAEFDQNSSATVEKNPLIAWLPFIDNLYRVDYGPSVKNPDDPNAVAIYIRSISEEGKQQALEWIKFKEIDPATLEIIYQDLPRF